MPWRHTDCRGQNGAGPPGGLMTLHGLVQGVIRASMAQPTICRVYKSSKVAKYNPAFVCRNVRDVPHPHRMGPIGDKLQIQPVLRHGIRMPRVCGGLIFADNPRSELLRSHEPRDGLLRNLLARPSQRGGDFRTTVPATGGVKNLPNLRGPGGPVVGLRTGRPIPPGIVPASGNLQHPVGHFWASKIPQSLAGCGFQNCGAPEGTRTPASGSGGLRDIHFTTGAL